MKLDNSTVKERVRRLLVRDRTDAGERLVTDDDCTELVWEWVAAVAISSPHEVGVESLGYQVDVLMDLVREGAVLVGPALRERAERVQRAREVVRHG